MKLVIDLPDYREEGLHVFWDEGSVYKIHITEDKCVHLLANKNALISFAKQMLYMAYNDIPEGSHVHYDDFFTKVPDYGAEFILEKKM